RSPRPLRSRKPRRSWTCNTPTAAGTIAITKADGKARAGIGAATRIGPVTAGAAPTAGAAGITRERAPLSDTAPTTGLLLATDTEPIMGPMRATATAPAQATGDTAADTIVAEAAVAAEATAALAIGMTQGVIVAPVRSPGRRLRSRGDDSIWAQARRSRKLGPTR